MKQFWSTKILLGITVFFLSLLHVQTAGAENPPFPNSYTLETFEKANLGATYKNDSFIGENGIVWEYTDARNEYTYPIDGKGLVFRNTAGSIICRNIPNGIKHFLVNYRKAATGTGYRRISLFVNGDSITSVAPFGNGSGANDTIYTFLVENIDKAGNVSVEVRNTLNTSVTIDNISWVSFTLSLLKTLAADSVTYNSAILFGEIFDTTKLSAKGFLIGQNPSVGFENATAEFVSGNDTVFKAPIDGLFPDTIYYYRVFGIYLGDTILGNIMNFKTSKKEKPDIQTLEAFKVKRNSAQIGLVIPNGIIPNSRIESGLLFNTLPAFDFTDSHLISNVENDTLFKTLLTNLKDSTRYYYCAYIIYETDTIFGDTLDFCTQAARSANLETFEKSSLTATYKSGSFVGDNGFAWSYFGARNEGAYAINGKGIILQNKTAGSSLVSEAIPDGIGMFSIELKKAFSTNAKRQMALYINGDSICESFSFGATADDSSNIYLFSYPVKRSGNIQIEIRNISNYQICIDNLRWTNYSVPAIKTFAPKNVKERSAVIGGCIAMDSSSEIHEVGLVWSEEKNLSFENCFRKTCALNDSTFETEITALKTGTNYSFAAYAITSTDTVIGLQDHFTTKGVDIEFCETFDSLQISGTSYIDSSFVGDRNIRWRFAKARNEAAYPIREKGIMLQSKSSGSFLIADSVPYGIKSVSVKMRKGFTGKANRQIGIWINGNEKGKSEPFGNFSGASDTIYEYRIENIRITGNFALEIKSLADGQVVVDDISWQSYLPSEIELLLAEKNGADSLLLLANIRIADEIVPFEKGFLIDMDSNLHFSKSHRITIPSEKDFSALLPAKEYTSFYYQAYTINHYDTAFSETKYYISSESLPLHAISDITGISDEGIADSLNVKCRIRGIVHSPNLAYEGVWFSIYDGSGWINVYSNEYFSEDFSAEEGDELLCIGTVTQQNGFIRFVPETVAVVSSHNAMQEPAEVFMLNESSESKLVAIKGLHLSEGENWPTPVDIGNGKLVKCMLGNKTEINLWIVPASDLQNIEPPQGSFDITGIGIQDCPQKPYNSHYFIVPRGEKDLTFLSIKTPLTKEEPFSIYPNPANGKCIVVFHQPTTGKLHIYTKNGQRIRTAKINNEKELELRNLQAGIYFVVFKTEDIDVRKLVVK